MADTITTSGQTLEAQLEAMLDTETVRAPGRVPQARAAERPGDLRGGRAATGRAGGSSRPSELHWFKEPDRGPRRLQPAVLQVVQGRQDQRLLQLPGPPRRGRQRRPGRVPLARRGGRGARHHLRRPAPRRAEVRQRAQGPRDREGRHRRHLPADDPGGRGGDARLRADRRAAQRRLRRLLGRRGQGADGVLPAPRR